MEQATADRGPGGAASLPPGEQHAVTTSDGTEIRLTHYALGSKGPIVLAPGYGNAARAFAVDTVPKNYVQFLGEHGYDVWLLDYRASPDLRRAAPSSRSTTSRCATGRRPSTPSGGTPARTRSRPWATASAGCRSSWPSAAASKACARRPSRRWPATRSPRPATACAPARTWRRCSSKLGIKGLNTDYDPDYLPDRAVELVMRALPFRHVYDSPVGRRIYFVYGDVFDFSNINEETMDEAVPSIFGISNITFFEHISRMIRKSRAAIAPAGTPTWPTSIATACRSRSSPASTTGCSSRAGCSAATSTLRAANGPERYTPPCLQGLRAPGHVARRERRARHLPDRPRRAGAPGLVSTTADGPAPDTAGARAAALQDLFSYPRDVLPAGPPHAPGGAGRLAEGRRHELRERQRSPRR